MAKTQENRHWVVENKIVYDPVFQEAIQTRIECGDDFNTILNAVCGVITSYQVFQHSETIGGGSMEHCREQADAFELVIFDMLDKYQGDPADFRYNFLDTWTLVYNLYQMERKELVTN